MRIIARFLAPSMAWALVLVFALPLTQGGLLAQEPDTVKAQLFRDVDAAMQRAREAEAPLLAPTLFARATELYQRAEKDYQEGERLAAIRQRLDEAISTLNRAVEAARVSKVVLVEALEARRQFRELWLDRGLAARKLGEAERAFQEAARKAEAGDASGARSQAERASRAYREASLEALERGVVQRVAARLERARDRLGPERYSAAVRELSAVTSTLRESREELEIAALATEVWTKVRQVLRTALAGRQGRAAPARPVPAVFYSDIPLHPLYDLGMTDDKFATDEDTDIYINVLENDGSTTAFLVAWPTTTNKDAKVSRGPGGTLNYDPRGSLTLQAQPAHAVVVDSFTYGAFDGKGGWGGATVEVFVRGRGSADVFVVNLYESSEVWSNDGSGVFTKSGPSLAGGGSTAVALGDLDGDGDLDAVVASDLNWSRVWINDGSGVFHSFQAFDIEHQGVALGDLNGDGALDIYFAIAPSSSLTTCKVWLNGGSGNFTCLQAPSVGWPSEDVALGDLDGDGDLDAIEITGPWTHVFLNDGSGKFQLDGEYLTSDSSGSIRNRAVALGDLNGDGDLDAVVATSTEPPWSNPPNPVWLNNGFGKFTESGQQLGEASSFGVALGDLDGDGDLDAFVANELVTSEPSITRGNTVWLNDGKGNFTDSGQLLGDQFSRDVALADLDDDGDLDAYVANYEGTNTVWLNDGSAMFTPQPNVGYPAGFGVALGDLDGT